MKTSFPPKNKSSTYVSFKCELHWSAFEGTHNRINNTLWLKAHNPRCRSESNVIWRKE